MQQKIHSLGTNGKNGRPFYTGTLFTNNRPIKFIIDRRSPVTLIRKSKFNNTTAIKPVTIDYRDVNDSRIKFERNNNCKLRNRRCNTTTGAFDNNQKHTPTTRTRLNDTNGINTRNGLNHHKQQPCEQAREHDRANYNITQT